MASPGSVVIQFLVDAKKAAKDAADLAKNFGKVDKEADGLDSTLSGLENELDAIGRGTAALKTDMGKAEVGFDSVGDEAEQTADRLRRAARDMSQGVHQGAAGIDTETDHIRGNLKETGKEAGAEFIGNVAEGIGSGTANVTEVMQGTLGGLTNLAATLGGPVGLAAAGAAAGIGVVFSAMQKQAEEAKARIVEMNDLLKDLGTTAGKAAEKLIFQSWIDSFAEMPGELNAIVGGLHAAGVTTETWRKAVAGSASAQEKVRTQTGLTAREIIRAQKAHIPLTAQQQAFLKAQPAINKELAKQAGTIDESQKSMDTINWLTGKTVDTAKLWVDSLGEVKTTVVGVKDELDSVPDTIPINFRVNVTDSKGRPVAPGHISPVAVGATPAVAATATAAPVTVNVHATTTGIPNTAREVRALLDSHDLRMGRKPGTPRSVAW